MMEVSAVSKSLRPFRAGIVSLDLTRKLPGRIHFRPNDVTETCATSARKMFPPGPAPRHSTPVRHE